MKRLPKWAMLLSIFSFLFILFQNFSPSVPVDANVVMRSSGDSKTLVGAYYFGVFNPSFRFGYKDYIANWPLEVQQRPKIWWYGVEDFYKKEGGAYADLVRRFPDYDTSHLKPLIGYHDNSTVAVMEKHIDQASQGGLDYFNFYWYWSKDRKSEVMQESLMAFKKARNKNLLKFQISMYFSPWTPDFNLTADDAVYAVNQLIEHVKDPQYLRLDGRPVITIGDGRNIRDGSLRAVQDMSGYIRMRFNQAQVGNPIILVQPGAVERWDQTLADGYQCLVPSPHLIGHASDHKAYVDDNEAFFNHMRSFGTSFSPCVASGFDERPRYKMFITNPLDLRFFKNFKLSDFSRSLKVAADSSARDGTAIGRLVNVYAWNEWHEGGIIEPTVKDGTLYLETIEAQLKTRPLYTYKHSLGHRTSSVAGQANGYQLEKTVKLFSEKRFGQEQKIALYECRTHGADRPERFFSVDIRCEGQFNVLGTQPAGYALKSKDGRRLPLKAIYRCNDYGFSHFISDRTDCDKTPGRDIRNEGLLGYIPN